MTQLLDIDYGGVSLGKGRMYLNRPRPHRLPVSTLIDVSIRLNSTCIGLPEKAETMGRGTIDINTKLLSPLERLEGEFDFASVGITKPPHDGRSTLQHLYTME